MAKAKPVTGLDPQAPTGKNARIIARVRLEELYDWDRYVDNPECKRELHNLRIAAKRLRYTLEVFEDVLPEACKPIVKELEQIQEELGLLHDSDVMIALLQLCLSGPQIKHTLPEVLEAEGKERIELPSQLVADLADSATAPTAGERSGLEQLLHRQQELREKRYTIFRQHWYQLQAQDFRSQVLKTLNE